MWEQGPGDEVNLPCLAELTHFLIYSFNISIFFPCYSKRPAIHFDWVQNSPWQNEREECKHAVGRKRQTCDGMYYVACSSPINRPEIRATERSVHIRYISGKEWVIINGHIQWFSCGTADGLDLKRSWKGCALICWNSFWEPKKWSKRADISVLCSVFLRFFLANRTKKSLWRAPSITE